MPRYNPRTGARLVNRELRIRPTGERAAAMDDLDARYRKQQARHDQLEGADWRLRRQLGTVEAEARSVSRARHPGERRKLDRQAAELQRQLSQTRADIRKNDRAMDETRQTAAAQHAAAQTLEMSCPSCGEPTEPDQVQKVRAWTSFRRAWYECAECDHSWSART
jgi:DNA-directed RNA polymerase subunit M/transcription elongation factor TFIIS